MSWLLLVSAAWGEEFHVCCSKSFFRTSWPGSFKRHGENEATCNADLTESQMGKA
jgi:hypothetical protein